MKILWGFLIVMFAGAGIVGLTSLSTTDDVGTSIATSCVAFALAYLCWRKFTGTHKKKLASEASERYNASPVVQAANQIESGILPVYTESSIVRKDEITHFMCQAVRYITKNRVVGRTASTAGISVRVAKGVSLRSGGIRGQSVYGDVTGTFLGEFVLTNKRLMFIHEQHGFECTLNTLDAITEGDKGKVIIQKSNLSCVLHFVIAKDKKKGRLTTIDGTPILTRAIALIQNQGNAPVVNSPPSAQETASQPASSVVSVADEIMKFKSLYDSGVINEKEFEQKKNELLKI